MSHDWQQKIIPSSGVCWRRAWWSSYRLPWLSARVGPLMSLSHDPSLTRLSGLRTNTCCDPLGRHAFRAQTASCEATKGALRQSLLRQPVVRAEGPSSRLPGRCEDTSRWHHRVRTSPTIRGWRSHLPPGRAPHPPTRPRKLRHRLAERALYVTAALPYCPLDIAVLPRPDRRTPLALYCAVGLIATATCEQQPFFIESGHRLVRTRWWHLRDKLLPPSCACCGYQIRRASNTLRLFPNSSRAAAMASTPPPFRTTPPPTPPRVRAPPSPPLGPSAAGASSPARPHADTSYTVWPLLLGRPASWALVPLRARPARR